VIYLLEWAARLVLALGAEAKIDAVPGSSEYALPFTTLEHALVRINNLLKLLMFNRLSCIICHCPFGSITKNLKCLCCIFRFHVKYIISSMILFVHVF
jgi:hypothetical protein